MVWKRLKVGGQFGICCQGAQLTVPERLGEAAAYGLSREAESCRGAAVSVGERERALGTE